MSKTDERHLIEASAWRSYFTEKGLDSDPGFDAWLAQDIRNQHAWDHVQSSWDFFGEQATAPEVLDLRRSALARARSAGRQRWSTAPLRVHWKRWAAAASVVVATAVAVTWNETRPDVYRTDAGERRQVTLVDGSKVQMDASTELRVKYSDQARELTLKHGQARFDVAPNVERPFSVLAGGRKVVALGTAFNVDVFGKDLLVTLIEGRIVILPKGEGALRASSNAGGRAGGEGTTAAPIELAAGQQLSVSAGGTARVENASVQRATAWQNGQLIFDDEALSTVIERVNRYTTRPLSIEDGTIANLRISGVFNAGDVEGFVATITRYLPVSARESTDTIRLSRR